MEGMPRFSPILPDMKKPANEYDEDFVYSLKEYILLHFQDDPDNYNNAITELRNMKQEILKCHVDVEAVCILKRYFAQLLMMKNRFPMEQGGAVRAIFSWYERALEMPTAQSYADINFEMACVMYQIGAIHASIAGQESRQSDDSIKNAFMHFQYAAWPFQHIRDTMDIAMFGTSDFDKELLTFHINVLLAQAQECLLEKSLLDPKRSPLIVVKLATYLRDLYSQCLTLLRNSTTAVEMLSPKKFKLWTRTVAVKSEIYGSIAMLYMSYKEEQEQHFGNRLGWCKAADYYLKRAIKIASEADGEFTETVAFVRDVIQGRLENAQKENDFIYHERVPKIEDLIPTVEGEGKVKPRSFDPLDHSISGDDIFGSLVPPTVLSAVSQYEEEKAKLKREVFQRVNDKTQEIEKFMESLNAEELSLKLTGSTFVPPDILLERNASMHSQVDAIPHVLERLQLVDQLARDADSQLNALSTRLKAVDLPEFTEDDGYKAISAEITRLTEHHIQARGLNAELHKALAAHSTNIHLLSLPLRELVEKIAPRETDVSPAATKEGEALIRVLDKVNEMRMQRAMLVDTFVKELDNDNISKKLLAERDTDNTGTFAAELKKHDKNIQYIDANLAAQSNIIHHLTEANADFAEQRRVIQELNKDRSEQVMTLCAAYDIYMDVSNKANDGKRFYENLLQRIGKLGNAIESIEATYLQERERIETERRAVEEKKAAIRAAREAREALADFGGVNQSPSQPSTTAPPAGGRPRLGDYMQFYKNKMAAKGSPNLPFQIAPSQLSISEQRFMTPQPPSPAPSSIAGDFHGEAQFHPEHFAPMSKPYVSPVPSSYSPQTTPIEQRLPSGPAFSDSMIQNQQFYLPPQSTTRLVHSQIQPISSQPTQYSHSSASTAPQQQMPPIQPSQQAPIGYQYRGFQQTPSYPSGMSSSHSSNSELSRIAQSATPTFPVSTPEPQFTNPVYQQAQQVPYQPQTQSIHQAILPSQGTSLNYSNAQNYQNYGLPASHTQTQYMGSQVSTQFPTHQVIPAVQQPYNSQSSSRTVQSHHEVPPCNTNFPTSYHQPQTQTIHQATFPPQGNLSDGQLPTKPVQPHQEIPPQLSQYQPPVQIPVQPSQKVEPPASQSVLKPVQPTANNIASHTNGQPVPAAPWHTQQVPAISTASSPWHNNPRFSPWHQSLQSNRTPVSILPQPVPTQQETPVLGQGTPQTSTNHIPQSSSSNVDLLSSLLGDLNLPPAIAPSQAIHEYHPLQRAAPACTNRSSPLVTVAHEAPVVRPAAAVIPIQQKTVPVVSDSPILSMVTPSTVSIAPQNPISLTELIDPEKFKLGETDKMRLEKRQLHTAIKNNAPLPSLDPNDPLNTLDPFWGVKKM